MQIIKKIAEYIQKHRCTFLGVGTMSLNCVDAATELVNASFSKRIEIF